MPAASLSTGRVGRRGRNLAALLLLGALACLPTGALAARSASEQEKIGKNLYTSSVTYCAPPTGILVSSFSFEYFEKNQSANFELSAATVSDNLNPEAVISLDIYGIKPNNWTINVCSYLDGLLCPLPQINFTGGSPLPVPASIVKDIPSIAYTVPNLEAYVTVIFNDVESGEQIACLQASLANGWSTRQDGVLWGTSMFALLAVAVAWLHTAWNYSRLDPLTLTRGDAAAVGPTEAELAAGGLVTGSSSPAQWRAVDVVYLFQTIASCGLLTIDYPSVFSAFVLNFRWSLGIFTTPAVQRAIVSARNKTGGKMSSEAYPEIAFINKKTAYHAAVGGSSSSSSATSIFAAYVQPTYNKVSDLLSATLPASAANGLAKRAAVDSSTSTSAAAEILNGIPVYVESLGVPTANAFMTVFFTWLMVVAVFVAFHLLGWVVVVVVDRLRSRRHARGTDRGWWIGRLRSNYKFVVLANALRVALMLFFPICIFSLYQFTLNDAWLPIFLAAITLFITVAGLLLAEGSILLAARRARTASRSSHGALADKERRHSLTDGSSSSSPAPVDRENSSVTLTHAGHGTRHIAGIRAVPGSLWSPFPNLRPHCSALYQQYRRPLHTFWLLPLLLATFAKACFIAFGQNHGFVQIIALIVIEGLTFVAIVAVRPHTNKKGDWLSAVLALFRLVGTGLMLAFFARLGASGIVRTVLGLVCVAVWGFAVLTLLVGLFVNAFWGIIWKRHTPSSPIDDEAAADIQLAEEPRPVMMEKEGIEPHNTLIAPPPQGAMDDRESSIPTFGDRFSTDEHAYAGQQQPMRDGFAPVPEPVAYAPVTDEPGSVAHHSQRPVSGASFATADSHLPTHGGVPVAAADGSAPLYTPATPHSTYYDARETPGAGGATPQPGLNEKDPGGYFRSA